VPLLLSFYESSNISGVCHALGLRALRHRAPAFYAELTITDFTDDYALYAPQPAEFSHRPQLSASSRLFPPLSTVLLIHSPSRPAPPPPCTTTTKSNRNALPYTHSSQLHYLLPLPYIFKILTFISKSL
jgi:hypothetical protein